MSTREESADLGSISQKVVNLRLIVSVISKLLIGGNSHLRLILDLQLFVKSTTAVTKKWVNNIQT
jgi:hypothetical protein